MKKRPSDYCNGLRYLKRSNIPTSDASFLITGVEEAEKTNKFTGKSECLIQLIFDERWRFDLKGNNLTTVIELLGDDFDGWYGKRLTLRIATFTKEDRATQEFIKVVRPAKTTLSRKNRPAPKDQTGTVRPAAEKQPENSALD
jgi:hypothetical protein